MAEEVHLEHNRDARAAVIFLRGGARPLLPPSDKHV